MDDLPDTANHAENGSERKFHIALDFADPDKSREVRKLLEFADLSVCSDPAQARVILGDGTNAGSFDA
ncbi:MAG: hypothetical protein GKR90_05995 [Pseudomonadales bacterium]|nr:hypothetical protein [Pseudomonadales bacterium]